MSVQAAVELTTQKLTCPTVTGVEPPTTVAVRVTTAPWLTEVTGLPPEVMARLVVVAVWPWAAIAVAARTAPASRDGARVARKDEPDERGLNKNRLSAPAALRNMELPRTVG